ANYIRPRCLSAEQLRKPPHHKCCTTGIALSFTSWGRTVGAPALTNWRGGLAPTLHRSYSLRESHTQYDRISLFVVLDDVRREIQGQILSIGRLHGETALLLINPAHGPVKDLLICFELFFTHSILPRRGDVGRVATWRGWRQMRMW